jgi:hypothetical protein
MLVSDAGGSWKRAAAAAGTHSDLTTEGCRAGFGLPWSTHAIKSGAIGGGDRSVARSPSAELSRAPIRGAGGLAQATPREPGAEPARGGAAPCWADQVTGRVRCPGARRKCRNTRTRQRVPARRMGSTPPSRGTRSPPRNPAHRCSSKRRGHARRSSGSCSGSGTRPPARGRGKRPPTRRGTSPAPGLCGSAGSSRLFGTSRPPGHRPCRF